MSGKVWMSVAMPTAENNASAMVELEMSEAEAAGLCGRIKLERERLARNNTTPMAPKMTLGMKNNDRASAAWKAEASGAGESWLTDAMMLPVPSKKNAWNHA